MPKETADLLRIYCIFNNRKITEFATSILNKELAAFKQHLNASKKLNS